MELDCRLRRAKIYVCTDNAFYPAILAFQTHPPRPKTSLQCIAKKIIYVEELMLSPSEMKFRLRSSSGK
jgi:hypothetical protein